MRDHVAIPTKSEFGRMELEETIGDIESCRTIDELVQGLKKISENYGFASFNFLDTGAPQVDVPFFIGTLKKDFVENIVMKKSSMLIHACLLQGVLISPSPGTI